MVISLGDTWLVELMAQAMVVSDNNGIGDHGLRLRSLAEAHEFLMDVEKDRPSKA
jgi:hypothetical protein